MQARQRSCVCALWFRTSQRLLPILYNVLLAAHVRIICVALWQSPTSVQRPLPLSPASGGEQNAIMMQNADLHGRWREAKAKVQTLRIRRRRRRRRRTETAAACRMKEMCTLSYMLSPAHPPRLRWNTTALCYLLIRPRRSVPYILTRGCE